MMHEYELIQTATKNEKATNEKEMENKQEQVIERE